MKSFARTVFALLVTLLTYTVLAQTAAREGDNEFEPVSGQAGKDVVWVPTPSVLVEKMLDLAKVTPDDFVMDLGSGDGRNIIAAAKRGARSLGVEYNPDMVTLSKRIAAKEGVAEKAQFVEGDMYEADISEATVLALFLLPENLDRLVNKFLAMKPGTRIVMNTFGITGWKADQIERAEGDCGNWCEALLYIVPAKVAGQWKFGPGTLSFEQHYQTLTGGLDANGKQSKVSNARLLGDRIVFTIDGVEYTGRVDGDVIAGTANRGGVKNWTATRVYP